MIGKGRGKGDLAAIRDSLPHVLQRIVDLVQMRMETEASAEANESGFAFCQLLQQLAETESEEPEQREINEKLANEFQTLLQAYNTLGEAVRVLRSQVGDEASSSEITSVGDSESPQGSVGVQSLYPSLQKWFQDRNQAVQDIKIALPDELQHVVDLVCERMNSSWEYTDAFQLCQTLQRLATDVETHVLKETFLTKLQENETLKEAFHALIATFAEGHGPTESLVVAGEDIERLMTSWAPIPALNMIKDRLRVLRKQDTSNRCVVEAFQLFDELFNSASVRTRGSGTNDPTDELGQELLDLLKDSQNLEEVVIRIREDYF